jgi:YVTN family beta-propeller protein
VTRPALVALSILVAAVAIPAGYKAIQALLPNSTGKIIDPIDKGVPVGSYPVQMKLSPNGKFLVVTNTGFRQQLSVIDTSTGKVVSKHEFNGTLANKNKESLYWGLDFKGNDLYVSRGPEDKVSVYNLSNSGTLTFVKDIANPAPKGNPIPNFVSGLLCDGDTLYALNNESSPATEWKGTVSEIDLATGEVRGKILVGGFPLSVAVATQAGDRDKEIYVCSEQDGVVSYFHEGARVAEDIRVGANPTSLLVRNDRLYVSNAGSDTISVIDTTKHNVVKTILLRPVQMRNLPLCTPLGLDLSRDGETMYVALADMNAVAIVDVDAGEVKGYLPTGWHPTDVKLSPDGDRLFVSNAKGTETRIPNGKPNGNLGTYVQNLIEGTVSMIQLDEATKNLDKWSRAVIANNGLATKPVALQNPGIKHVIYIIKENRTYDNVLGDLKGGNGDPSLCLFPREVTPNQHALAERFVLLDNFYCCAEVSGDGWNWSTAGAANEYVSRNVPFTYSDRGRDYDFEGTVNGKNPEEDEVNNVAAPPGGYLWDNAKKSRVSFRNYGFFVGQSDALGKKEGTPQEKEVVPTRKALIGVTDTNFNQYDMAYPDSDLTRHHGIDVPGELASFGKFKSPSRFSEWKREFDGFVKSGNMPSFQVIRFCRDHTSGTAVGKLSPRAMVADNDYAVGQLVEAVSNSTFWKDTVICVVEDDAQSGIDHVDCHRSIAFVVSPFVKTGTRDSRFYNTDSMIRTMESLLRMPPMNGFDAIASPLLVFGNKPENLSPYIAIKPSKQIAGAINQANAYRARDSAEISRFTEDSEMDEELNDILWGSVKGKPLRRPEADERTR